jgi:hypothetical protein
MRLLLDANILLDCLVLENSGLPRDRRDASAQILDLCDLGQHQGLVAWHTLPIISYYYGRQNSPDQTAALMDALLRLVESPTTGHADASAWRNHGISDFEDALQVASAIAGFADFIITRNGEDFAKSPIPSLTPEECLKRFS